MMPNRVRQTMIDQHSNESRRRSGGGLEDAEKSQPSDSAGGAPAAQGDGGRVQDGGSAKWNVVDTQ